MKKIALLFHTVKYLKWQQIYHRLLRLVKSHPKVSQTQTGHMTISKEWLHNPLFDEKITPELEATFLNQSKKLVLPFDWDNESPSKLWVYNLHYFETLLSFDCREKHAFHLELLERWIRENPIGKGNAWEPYPISLRISNILKAWLGGLPLSKNIQQSLYQQADYLSQDLEKHLLGNHYFVNLKALLFAGVVFEQTKWRDIAQEALYKEIPEQILPDGANFELAPMYHDLILVDMLDMHNLALAYPSSVTQKLKSLLKSKIPLMISYMQTMRHPDGGVAFFNDSTNKIAPEMATILDYAKRLGFETNEKRLDNSVFNGEASGYFVAQYGVSKLIVDGAKVGPDYIPGHGHADTLSLELSIGRERVLVNRGTSVYGLSKERLSQRKTLAHNTVEVDGRDSSQVWSGFRVAKRAKIIERTIDGASGNQVTFQATHNGYKNIFGGCYHQRRVEFSQNRLVVNDQLIGNYKKAVGRFHFHPALNVELSKGNLIVSGKTFVMQATVGKEARLIDVNWHPGFSQSIGTKALEFPVLNHFNQIVFTWS